MAAYREALRALVAGLAAEDRIVQERRQALRAYHAAVGAGNVRSAALPGSTVHSPATEYVAGAAFAAVMEQQVCSVVPAEPVVWCLVALAPALVQYGVALERSLSGRRVETGEALVGLVLAPSAAVADHLAVWAVDTCREVGESAHWRTPEGLVHAAAEDSGGLKAVAVAVEDLAIQIQAWAHEDSEFQACALEHYVVQA